MSVLFNKPGIVTFCPYPQITLRNSIFFVSLKRYFIQQNQTSINSIYAPQLFSRVKTFFHLKFLLNSVIILHNGTWIDKSPSIILHNSKKFDVYFR